MEYIREYTEAWSDDFGDIARFLGTTLPCGCSVHHVGSTSVPGMPAKDIVDIDIECPHGSMKRVIDWLAEAGYDHQGDRGIPTREAFTPREGSRAALLRPHHLYACETGSPALRVHLATRDYLLSHPERASWLAAAKRRADSAAPTRADYIEAKVAAYEKIAREAESWSSEGGDR